MTTDNNSSENNTSSIGSSKKNYDADKLRQIVEGALLAAGKPLSVQQLRELFDEDAQPPKDTVEAVLGDIQADCKGKGYELKEVANGWRFQVRQELSPWVLRLWEEKPQKYSRALLETLALVAYRQPITRGEIEDIRGVAVSTQIIKTLQERNWVRVVGHRDVPGRPAMYATTRDFLDYFNLKSLEELPTLAEIRDLNSIGNELDLVQDNSIAAAFADHNGEAVAGEEGDVVESGADGVESSEDDHEITASAQPIGDEDSDADTFVAAADDAAEAVTDNVEGSNADDERVLH
jgi:segregation and condensation protein B